MADYESLSPEQKKAADEYMAAFRSAPNMLLGKKQVEQIAEAKRAVKEREAPTAFGAESWDEAAERYRQLGGQNQAALTLDQGQADQARGFQMGSLGMLQNAAQGGAPSQAAILGRAQTSAALGAGMGQAAQARGGPGAQVAAMRAASMGAGQQMERAGAAAMNQRAAEMGQARGVYASGAGSVRGQDLSAASKNAALEAEQRLMNEKRQQDYERRGFDTRNMQLNTGVQKEQTFQTIKQGIEADNRNDVAAGDKTAVDGFKTWAAGMGGGVSDERAKRNVVPIGSLSPFMSRGR